MRCNRSDSVASAPNAVSISTNTTPVLYMSTAEEYNPVPPRCSGAQ